MTQPAAPTAAAYCRNCSLFLGAKQGNYCPNCGQDTALHPPTAWEFLHEFVSHYVALEGRLTRTLGLLLFRPGELTARYLAGRKNSYVLPLRLYLSASIVFFLVVKIFGAGSLVKENVDTSRDVAGTAASAGVTHKGLRVGRAGTPVETFVVDPQDMQSPFADVIQCDNFAAAQCAKLKGYLKEKYQAQTMAEVGRQVKDRTISLAPYAIFAFVPVFALFTQLLYLRRRMYYGEHLVYAFHVHAFAFLVLLGVSLANKAVGDLLGIAGMIYFWFAMRRVFGGRWWATSLRFLTISIVYPLLLSLAILLTLVAAVFA